MLNQKTKPLGFRQWIICEDHKNQVIESAGGSEFPDKVLNYLSAVFGISKDKLEKKDWVECYHLFTKAVLESPKIDIPLIKDAPAHAKEVDWHYPGRTLYYYSHVLAGAYGWDLEYISNLEVREALALIQEILIDKHLDSEFQYSLSEIAYPYNKSTKKSSYKPLERPYYMRPAVAPVPKKMKMRRDTLPVGLIMDVSGLPDEFKIEGLETVKPK